MNKSTKAAEFFNSGYNCAQAVFAAYCEKFGIDKKEAFKIASGFGGGMGRLQEVCGAVTGAFMVLSLKYGSIKENDIISKEQLYSKIREFDKRFKERNKTINCKELLGVDLINGDKVKNAIRVKAVCPALVKDAAEILEELI